MEKMFRLKNREGMLASTILFILHFDNEIMPNDVLIKENIAHYFGPDFAVINITLNFQHLLANKRDDYVV